MNAVDKIYFNFGILYNKMIDEKPLSSGYRVKSNYILYFMLGRIRILLTPYMTPFIIFTGRYADVKMG